jgi:hypothetical protein
LKYQYVWFLWASAFLVPWTLLYIVQPAMRRQMLEVSAATSLLGLTEPLFVPEYWNPPTLFELAQRTGFDIESLIFCFAIGGIAAVLYNAGAPALDARARSRTALRPAPLSPAGSGRALRRVLAALLLALEPDLSGHRRAGDRRRGKRLLPARPGA